MFDRKQFERDRRGLRKELGGRKLHHHEKNECGKVAYQTKYDVVSVAATRITSRTADSSYLRPYLCPACGYWHLTSKERTWK